MVDMKGLVGLLIGLVPLYIFIVISQATKKTLVIQVKSMKSTLCHCLKISLLFFLLLSCDGRRRKDSRVLDIITADLERRDNISVNDLFSNIQLIPLETTQESLIRTITQIRFLRVGTISTIIQGHESLFSMKMGIFIHP